MKVTLKYFASLREELNLSEEMLELPLDITTGQALRHFLQQRGPQWAHALRDERVLQFAVNQVRSTWASGFKNNDELALFPPVTGG